MVNISGDLEETSAAYYHTAQSGNVIIQSANISKLLGKVDAFVNKSGFQKPRYFIEDVSDKKEKSEKQREEQKKTLVQELHDDIIAKLKPANYTGNERKYVEGALKHIDFLVDENVNFLKNENADIATGFYDGKLNITHSDNSLRDDIKITIFHEYLHHVNYMEKIYPYRYEDESIRKIFQIKDDKYFLEAPMNDVYMDYLYYNQDLQNNPLWEKDSYADLGKRERQILEEYKQKNKEEYMKPKKGTYMPSNYYRDEIAVYIICLKENHNLFVFSDKKENQAYKPNLKNYYDILQRSIDYEKRKSYNEEGYSM